MNNTGIVSSITNISGNTNSISSSVNVPSYFIDTATNNSVIKADSLIVSNRNILAELDELRNELRLLKHNVKMEEMFPRLKQLKNDYEQALETYNTFILIKEST